MKKILWLFILILFIQIPSLAETVYDDNYEENPNYIQGSKYLANSQYSSAINEFKKAIRSNPNDISSIIGLSNAYNMRAVYYNNTAKSTDKAISDIKSALFFVKYFPDSSNFASSQTILSMEKNLSVLENSTQETITSEKRFNDAKSLRIKGEFAAAGYDYYQLLNDSKYSPQASNALGDIYKIFNRPNKALNMYKKALASEPNNTDIHLKLARTYEQLNDFSSSLKEYSIALENSSERNDILNSLEKIWQKKVDEAPNDAENHANLGVVFQKQKRYNEALAEYKKAESLNPSNINTKINIGTLYQEQKNYNAAINTYNTILQMQPQNTKILVYKAECLKELKKNDEAISLYKTALNLEPQNTAIKAELFELMKETMPTEDVLAFLYKNVQNSPMNADAYYEFAYELHKANKIDDAITYYLQTIKTDKTKIDAYINLSQAYRQKQNFADAFAVIKKAQILAPDNEQVKKQYEIAAKEFGASSYNIASNYFQSGDYQKAILEYKKIDPPTADSLLGIAASYQSLSDNTQAIEYYKQAMEQDSKNSDIPFYIASLYAYSNDLTNAKTYIDLSLSKNPNNKQAKELAEYIGNKESEGIFTNAIALYDSQKYNEAIKELDKVIKLSPANSSAYYYRALSYDAVKEYQKAISDYKLTLKYAPEMTIVYYSIGVNYDSLSNYKAAKENYKKYIELCNDENDYTKYAQSRIAEIE